MKSRSPALMNKLRVLNLLTTRIGISLVPERLTSAVYFFADRESCSWDPGFIKVRAKVLQFLLAEYAHVGVAADGTWAYRRLGFYTVAMREVSLAALEEDWGSDRARLYYPPIDLIAMTMRKMRKEGERGILLVPDWREAP